VYHLLLYDVVDQFAERRTPYRDAHLKLARAAADNGELLLAGAFADPLDGTAPCLQGRRPVRCRAIRGERPLCHGRTRDEVDGPEVDRRSRSRTLAIFQAVCLACAQTWVFCIPPPRLPTQRPALPIRSAH
jgi:uncharacterized protein